MISPEDRERALNWLYETGNPIIRLWAAERLGAPADELARLRAEMIAHPAVQYWVDCLLSAAEKPVIHNSFDTCLENSMRKVLLFGVREQDDRRLKYFNDGALDRLSHLLEHPGWLNPVEYTILASYLNAMGRSEKAVLDTLRERLDAAHWFAANGEYDIHTYPAGYPTIPAARRSHPLIHPKFYPDNRYLYPLVYDLFAWSRLPAALNTPDNAGKIDAVIRCVLDERYQQLPWGYGLIFVKPNKYYGMGWSVHLPRFFGEEEQRISASGSLWWAEAMAPFPAAAGSGWFQHMLEHLNGFRTADGMWKFPAAYLTEAKDKYFVGGGHMGLGEDRKNRDALKIESTVWMMQIYELTGIHSAKTGTET